MFDFNTISKPSQSKSNNPSMILPDGTKVTLKVLEVMQPHDSMQGDFIYKNEKTGSEYLKLKLLVIKPEHVFSTPIVYQMIGLVGKGGDKESTWAVGGKKMILDILEEGNGIRKGDDSERSQRIRNLKSYKGLEGLEFNAILKLVSDPDGKYDDKNEIKKILRGAAAAKSSHVANDSLDDPIPF